MFAFTFTQPRKIGGPQIETESTPQNKYWPAPSQPPMLCQLFGSAVVCLSLPAAALSSMTSFSVVFLLLSVVLGITNGFVVAPSSSLNVRRQSQTGGLQMLFGGGAKKKAGGGIVVKVQQKTGFKETEVTLAGKTNLRKALMDNKIDVYPLQV